MNIKHIQILSEAEADPADAKNPGGCQLLLFNNLAQRTLNTISPLL